MGKLDIAMVVFVGLGGLGCFRIGFTRSVWGIAAMFSGVLAASQLWRDVALILQRFINHESLAKWASIVAIAVSVSIIMDVIFERIQKIIDRGILGWINHAVGGAFGVVSSSILIGCLLLLLDRYGGETSKEAIANSRFAAPILEFTHQVFDFGKEVVKEQVNKL
jgi:uncharacterized membrane protein required for colicin V production